MNEPITIDTKQKADFSMHPEFPVKLYHTDLKQKPGGYNSWHWHDELQFCLIQSGTVLITVKNKQYILNSGDGIFINHGLLHMTKPYSTLNAEYLCINVHPHLFSFSPESIIGRKYFTPFISNEDFEVFPLYQDIPWQKQLLLEQKGIEASFSEKSWDAELNIFIHLLKIWKELISHINTDTPPKIPETNREITEILMFIQKHFHEKITLNDISRAVHLSKSSCCHTFKKNLNCTILEYITLCRIQHSMQLLESADMSITAAALESGFSDISYFIKKFRQITGMTPLSYKERKDT